MELTADLVQIVTQLLTTITALLMAWLAWRTCLRTPTQDAVPAAGHDDAKTWKTKKF